MFYWYLPGDMPRKRHFYHMKNEYRKKRNRSVSITHCSMESSISHHSSLVSHHSPLVVSISLSTRDVLKVSLPIEVFYGSRASTPSQLSDRLNSKHLLSEGILFLFFVPTLFSFWESTTKSLRVVSNYCTPQYYYD